MKKDRVKDVFLAQLRKVPIVEVACQHAGVARSTVYKWRAEDEEFRADMEAALGEGEAMLNDLSENQLYSLILERKFPAIAFWLRHRNPKFKDKLEVTTRQVEDDVDANEDAAVEAGLAVLEDITSQDEQSDDTGIQSRPGADQKGPEAAPGGGAA
jgi:hypothetical protein